MWSKAERNEFYRISSSYGLPLPNFIEDEEAIAAGESVQRKGNLSYEKPTGTRDWSIFRALGELGNKTDEVMDEYAYSFLLMCRDVTSGDSNGRNVETPGPDDDAAGTKKRRRRTKNALEQAMREVEKIPVSRANRFLARVDLMDSLRLYILTNPMVM